MFLKLYFSKTVKHEVIRLIKWHKYMEVTENQVNVSSNIFKFAIALGHTIIL